MNATEPNPERRTKTARDRWATLIFLAALGLGLVRFVRLGQWSLWLDEALTLADCLHGDIWSYDNPLGYWVVKLCLGLQEGRPDEFSLRLASALAGFLVIPLTAWAFGPVLGKRGSAIAALFLACSAWELYWSQTARFYTMAQCLGLLGGGFLLRGMGRDSLFQSGLGLIATVGACLTHLSAGFLLAAWIGVPWVLHFFGLGQRGTARKDGGGKSGLVLLLMGAAGAVLAAGNLAEAWALWQAKKGGASAAHLVLTTGFYLSPWLGAGTLIGAFAVLRQRKPQQMLLLGLCVAGISAAVVASLFARVSAQYVFVFLPWLAALAAVPVAQWQRAENQSGATSWIAPAYVALIVLPSLSTMALYMTVRKGERPQWREAYQYVFEQREADDLILGMEAPVGEYYLSPRATDLRNQSHLIYFDSWRATAPQRWGRFGRKLWFVLNIEQLEDWDAKDRERLLTTLSSECRLVKVFPLTVESRDLSVWIYVRDA